MLYYAWSAWTPHLIHGPKLPNVKKRKKKLIVFNACHIGELCPKSRKCNPYRKTQNEIIFLLEFFYNINYIKYNINRSDKHLMLI